MDNSTWEVPAYEAIEIAEKASQYCVCVFVINEGEKLVSQLQRMKSIAAEVDIVIADGGSTDGSVAIDFLETVGVNTLLTKRGEGKLGAQMRMAFEWALTRGYRGVVVIDGNNKDSVEDIPRFAAALESGYDHVQGSRFIPGGQAINTPLSRLVGVRLIHAPVMRLFSGFRYTDTTNGFRGYSKKLLRSESVSVFRNVFTGYELHYYLALQAAKLGFKCVELPVSRRYPAKGKTPTKISPVRGNAGVLAKLFKTVAGHYSPPS